MARIKFGNFIVDARGKIAGNIYARNKSGAYAKGYVKPNNPQSAEQTAQRNLLSALAAAWGTLTDAQRQAWNAAAPEWPTTNAVGDPVIYSGEQLFIKVNLDLASAGGTTIPQRTTPAYKTTMPAFTGFSAVRAVGPPTAFNLSFTTATGYDPGIHVLSVFASAPQSEGVTSLKTPSYRKIGNYQPDPGTDVFNVEADYVSVYGSIPNEKKVFFRVFCIQSESGQKILAGASKADTTPA